MTDNTWKTSDAITRCAVCKIDLKGRFVYLDSAFEKLIGQKRETLFGKPILDFLDQPSQDIIRELTAKRNHYESFYDSATITLVNQSQRAIPVTAIISLNFIAGNPVNFIIIMTPLMTANPVGSDSAQHAVAFQAFLETILATDGISNWREFTHYLRLLGGAQQAGVYSIHGQTLEPLSVDSEESKKEFAFNTLPELTALHRHIAVNGGVYDFTDQEQYAQVIEQFRVAPDEFVIRIDIGGEIPYLIRLVYDDHTDLDIAREYLKSVMLTLKLVGRLPGIQETDEDKSEVINVQFVIGLLDSLQCGAALSDADGTIVGYNPTFADMLQCEEISPDVQTLAEQIGNQHDEAIKELFLRCYRDSNISTEQCRFDVRLPSGITATLAVVRLADSTDDLTSCIVLLPYSFQKNRTEPLGHSFWNTAVQTALGDVEQAVVEAQQLEESYQEKLGKAGSNRLGKVYALLQASQTKLQTIQKILSAVDNNEMETVTDLRVLVDDVFRRVRKLYPEKKAYLRYGTLPKISTKQQWLETVLERVFSSCLTDISSQKATINVQARVSEGCCTIDILDNNVQTKASNTSNKDEQTGKSPAKQDDKPPKISNLSEIRFLVESLNGKLDIKTKRKEGTTISIAFPVHETDPEIMSMDNSQPHTPASAMKSL